MFRLANSTSVRLGVDYFEFDNNLKLNIIKADGEDTSQVERAGLIVKYFKSKNNIYLDFVDFIVKEQGVKNV